MTTSAVDGRSAGWLARQVLGWLTALVVMTTLSFVVLMLPNVKFLGQPHELGSVIDVEATGHDRKCGKRCVCPEAQILVRVPDGSTAEDKDCLDDYAVGDRVTVRRTADGTDAQFDPPEPSQLALLALGLSGLLLSIAAVVKYRTPRTTREPHRTREPAS
ncbi:MAG: hypothetical protein JWO60_193 [Frankiales bacterium]|nr:hypothetical protein [Frankiales bacterium]